MPGPERQAGKRVSPDVGGQGMSARNINGSFFFGHVKDLVSKLAFSGIGQGLCQALAPPRYSRSPQGHQRPQVGPREESWESGSEEGRQSETATGLVSQGMCSRLRQAPYPWEGGQEGAEGGIMLLGEETHPCRGLAGSGQGGARWELVRQGQSPGTLPGGAFCGAQRVGTGPAGGASHPGQALFISKQLWPFLEACWVLQGHSWRNRSSLERMDRFPSGERTNCSLTASCPAHPVTSLHDHFPACATSAHPPTPGGVIFGLRLTINALLWHKAPFFLSFFVFGHAQGMWSSRARDGTGATAAT